MIDRDRLIELLTEAREKYDLLKDFGETDQSFEECCADYLYAEIEELTPPKELDDTIYWCRKKIDNRPRNMTENRREGYKDAMLQVMSYLHSKKGGEG